MKSRVRTVSPRATQALSLLGKQISLHRKQRGWKVADLAERLAVSRGTAARIEAGDASVSIGTVFEAAALVGMPLFSDEPSDILAEISETNLRLKLLPNRIRTVKIDYDEF